jgi:hypothetical protein
MVLSWARDFSSSFGFQDAAIVHFSHALLAILNSVGRLEPAGRALPQA